MKTTQFTFIAAFVACALATSALADSAIKADWTGKQIMQAMIDREEGDTRAQTMVMQLVAKNGHTRTREARAVSKKYGDTTKSTIKFTAPASLKNTAMLTIDEKATVLDDQWVYLPGLNSIKKIAAGDQKSSFFGTDLIYADLTRRRTEDYSYKRLADKAYKGATLYQVEATPNAEEKKVTGYTKLVLLINPETLLPVKTVAHIDDGSYKITEVNAVKTIKNIATPTKMTVGLIKDGGLHHKSVFEYKDIEINEAVDDAQFTKDKLKQ